MNLNEPSFFALSFRNSAVMARALAGFNALAAVRPEVLAAAPDFMREDYAAMKRDVDYSFDSFFAAGVAAIA